MLLCVLFSSRRHRSCAPVSGGRCGRNKPFSTCRWPKTRVALSRGFRRFQPQISVSVSLETLINKCICINGGKNRSQKEKKTRSLCYNLKASQEECYFIFIYVNLFIFHWTREHRCPAFFNLFTLPERPGLHWSNLSLALILHLCARQRKFLLFGWGGTRGDAIQQWAFKF
jgi:hypothetical protein